MLLFVATALFSSQVFADPNNAKSAIILAQNNLKSCYDAVKQAQAAGANVDQLAANLDEASGLLSDAQLAYAANNYTSAYGYAVQSQNELSGLISQAAALQQNANSNNTQSLVIVILSIIGSVAVLSGGIAAWFILSRTGRKS